MGTNLKRSKNLKSFIQTSDNVVKGGSTTCTEYYKALRLSIAVKCSTLNVTVLGTTCAGKSSMMHTIKHWSPTLVTASDRTVIVDTLN